MPLFNASSSLSYKQAKPRGSFSQKQSNKFNLVSKLAEAMDAGNSFSFTSSIPVVATSSVRPSLNATVIPGVQTTNSKFIPLLSSLNQNGSIKLDRSNYLLWHSLVLSIIRGHHLDRYVLGTKVCPPEFISDGSEVKVNLEFEDWNAVDQLLYGWLLGLMTIEVAAQMLHCKTAAQLWKAAQDLTGLRIE